MPYTLIECYRINNFRFRYIITGIELGETKIIVSSTSESGLRISSLPVNVQVFPPLALQPRNITMYVGTSVQITSKGGPYPDVNIVYSIQNGDVACKVSFFVLFFASQAMSCIP